MERKYFFTTLFLLLLVATLVLMYQVFAPFLTSLISAGVIVVVFYPWYKKLLGRLKAGQDNLAAFLACLSLTFIVVIPATLILILLFRELIDGAQFLSKEIQNFHFDKNKLLEWPLVSSLMGIITKYVDLSTIDLDSALVESVKKLSTIIVSKSSSFLKIFSNFFLILALVELNMFFLFRDGRQFVQYIQSLLPIPDIDKGHILGRMKETINASIYGSVLTAFIQGFLGGIAFVFLGLPSPILWGVLMAFMGFLPIVGPFLIWAPAAVYLFFQGHLFQAIFLVAWGVLVVGTSDNILRPYFISKVSSEGNRLNTLVLFLSVLGGIQAFGILGIVLGPLLVVFTLTLLELGRTALGMVSIEETEPIEWEVQDDEQPAT